MGAGRLAPAARRTMMSPEARIAMIARRAGLVALLLAVSVLPAAADPFTISFTAGDVKEVMNDTYDDPLSDATYLWGLWSIRAMPIVSGGTYDIFSGAVDATASGDFWTYAAPSAGVTWASPYGSEVANFYLKPASEHLGTAAHPLYFIADQPATAFQSYAFDNTRDNGYGRSTYLGVCGVDVLATDPGCNQTNVLPDSALFSFSFDSQLGSIPARVAVPGGRVEVLSGRKPADRMGHESVGRGLHRRRRQAADRSVSAGDRRGRPRLQRWPGLQGDDAGPRAGDALVGRPGPGGGRVGPPPAQIASQARRQTASRVVIPTRGTGRPAPASIPGREPP